MAGMRVVLTGANGFIGSHIAEDLARDDRFEPTLAMRATSDDQWIKDISCERKHFSLAEHDGYSDLVAGADVVIHNAGITRATSEDEFMRMNVDASVQLLQASIASGVKKFIYISSLTARGPDGRAGTADAPDSPYGRSKLNAELAIEKLAVQHPEVQIIILRLGGVYGPRDTDLLPLFKFGMKGLLVLPPKTLQAQPVFVEEVSAAVLACCQQPTFATSVVRIDIVGQEVFTWEEAAKTLTEVIKLRRKQRKPITVYSSRVWPLIGAKIQEAVSKLTGKPPYLDIRRALDTTVNAYTASTKPITEALPPYSHINFEAGSSKTLDWYKEKGWV